MELTSALTSGSSRKSAANMNAHLPSEQPNNANSDALGDNWKSALCVTSLYDSYVAVQHENESLREQLRQVQHANDLLQVEVRNSAKHKRPESEDGMDESQLVKEIRLLRAEKSQQELLFDKRRAHLESQLAEYKALYHDQVGKYQERFDLDPNEPKRVALSALTLQNALDQVMREKEEIAMQHGKLQQMYHALEQEQRQTTTALHAQVAELQGKRAAQATHRMRAVLEKWVFTRVAHSWKQWRLLVLSDRLQAKQRAEQQEFKQMADAKQKNMVQERAAKFVVKMLQSSTRRCFSEWKTRAHQKKEQRSRLHAFQSDRARAVLKRVYVVWKQDYTVSKSYSVGVNRVVKLMERHKKRQAWSAWAVVPLKAAMATTQRQNDSLRVEVSTLTTRVHELTEEYGAVVSAHVSLVEQVEINATTHVEQVQEHSQDREAVQARIVEVLRRRHAREMGRRHFGLWKRQSNSRRVARQKVKLMRQRHEQHLVRNTLTQWHVVAHEQRRYKHITTQIVQRMRLLGAYRCFLAWREFAAVKKQRVAALRRVVHHMKHQHLIKCFKTWHIYRQERHEQRRKLTVLCVTLTKFQTADFFAKWKGALVAITAQEEQVKRQEIEREWQQRLEQSKHEIKTIRQYFQTWQTTIKSGKKYKQMAKKYAVKWKTGTLVNCFDEWKLFLARRRTQKEMLRRLASRRVLRDLQGGWTRWRTQALAKGKHDALAAAEREKEEHVERLEHELMQLRLTDSAARATSAERESELMADLQNVQQALHAAQGSCHQYKNAFKAVCLNVVQVRTIAKCLRAWRTAVRDINRRRHMVDAMLSRKRSRCVRVVFSGWDAQRRKRLKMCAAVAQLQSHWDRRVRGHCFQSWHGYAHLCHTIRLVTLRNVVNTRKRLCQSVFTAWHTETRMNRLLRKTLERIWLVSVHARMQYYLVQWSANAQAAKLHDELVRNKQALAAIQAKICGRWAAFSLKTVFVAWQRGVGQKKRARLGVQRLSRLHDTRLLAITFDGWQNFHGQVKVQRAWLHKWQEKQETDAKVASWSQWKTTTITKRREQMDALVLERQAQSDALAEKDTKLSTLGLRNDELAAQLAQITMERGSIGQSASKLEKKVPLVRALYQWRSVTASCKTTRARLMRFQTVCLVRKQRNVLKQWRDVVVMQQQRAHDALSMERLRWQQQLRHILRSWQSVTQKFATLKHQIARFRVRRESRMRAQAFQTWTVLIIRSHAVQKLTQTLTETTTRVALFEGFLTWKHATQLKKSLALRESNKQKRLMAFMLGKHEYAITKYFRAWKASARIRHERMQCVEKRLACVEKNRLGELWRRWVEFHGHQRQQAKCVSTLVRLLYRQRVRVGLRHWMKQITLCRVHLLQTVNQQLERDQEQLQRKLQVHSVHVDQLTAEVVALKADQVALRDTMQTTAATTEERHFTERRKVKIQLLLSKLVVQAHYVPCPVAAAHLAFQKWKERTLTMSHQRAALRRCLAMTTKKQLATALSYWRRRVVSSERREARLMRRQVVLYRNVWNEWRRFVHHRAVCRRRFIARWIEITHTVQTHEMLRKKMATAFQTWQLQTSLATATERLHMIASDQSKDELVSVSQNRKRLLTKWCWRAYHTNCGDLHHALTLWKQIVQNHRRDVLHHQIREWEKTQSNSKTLKSEQLPTVGSKPPLIEKTTEGLQGLFRRLANAQSVADLFQGVSTAFSQIFHGQASAVLFFVDPLRNELWTRHRDSQQIVQVPATLGIAGFCCSNMVTLLVENATADARFHLLVDQLAISGIIGGGGGSPTLSGDGIALFSSAIIGADGAVYGVLQVAFTSPVPEANNQRKHLQTHVQVLARAGNFFVEQMVVEMARHCRDKLRARSPESFAKLFKQTKNWRKYFAQVEKEANQTQQQLTQILQEQDFLLQEKARLQEAMQRLEEQERTREETQPQRSSDQEQLLMKHLVAYKKKATKLRELVQETEQRLHEKTQELDRVVAEHAQYRQEVRTREWQAMLTSATTAAASPQKTTRRATVWAAKSGAFEDPEEESGCGAASSSSQMKNHLLRGAEVATLKNELVRAESDSMFLVKAVDVATRHHGELPETLKMEVNRIALRLKKPREL